MKELIIFALSIALAWVSFPLCATERIDQSSSSTSTATGGAGGSGGIGGVAGSVTSRAVGIGLSAASNNKTCLITWAGGLLPWTDTGCARDRDIQMLHGLGMHDAAFQRACQDPEMWTAIHASADKSKCKTQPAWVTQ